MHSIKNKLKNYLIRRKTERFIRSFQRGAEDVQAEIKSSAWCHWVRKLIYRKKILNTSDEDISLIVFTSEKISVHTLFSHLKEWAATGVRIVIVADKPHLWTLLFNRRLKKLIKYRNVTIATASGFLTSAEKLKWALFQTETAYACVLDCQDFINVRSFFAKMAAMLKSVPNKAAYVYSEHGRGEIEKLRREMDISSLSGCIFCRERLYDILSGPASCRHGWLADAIFSSMKVDEIHVHQHKVVLNAERPAFIRGGVEGYARLVRDAVELADKAESLTYIMDQLEGFKRAVRNAAEQTSAKVDLGILASGCALLCTHLEPHCTEEEFENLARDVSSAFAFDSLLNRNTIHIVHRKIVEALIPVEEGTVAVIETKFMEDLRESIVPSLRERFNIIYITKRQYYDYPHFSFMIMRAKLQPSMFVITSNDMHHNIIGGKTNITMWHGLGMMKKIANVDRATNPMDYIVTSSKSCVGPWSETFMVSQEKVLPLGQVQTDILHNSAWRSDVKKQVKTDLALPDDCKIAFFAPTFRIGNNVPGAERYYNFMIDIENLSNRLKEENIVIITKKHHVFSHIMADKGIDASGVHTSENRHFIVDETHPFVELVAAADIFITDYSSGMFYSYVMNQPVMLYAPDMDTYRNGANGFMIDYPKAIPAPFVGEPDEEAFISALKEAEQWPAKPTYAAFREEHVGACDGHVAEKFMNFLATL